MTTSHFAGFRADALLFLKELSALQVDFDFAGAKQFYGANKSRYEREVKLPLGLLMEDVAARLKARKIPLMGDRKTALFRINRDVRFSRDKSPYKTHAGAVLTPDGARKTQGVLYVHIDPAGCFMAAGFHMPGPVQLARLRSMIRGSSGQFRHMAAQLALHGLSLECESEGTLKRPPRGFEDVAGADLLQAVKLKGYVVCRTLRDDQILEPQLAASVEAFAHEALPLLRFGWEALAREE